MPFELEPGSLSRQLRRLVRKELDAAIEALNYSGAPRIHDARKHIKKTRSIVKLLRRPLGKHYAKEDARLRAAGGGLSELRDAEVMLPPLPSLHILFPAQLAQAI
jgi:CHAD domain-containing protein